MIEFSRNVLKNKEDYVILDTETTGLGKNDVIVQIGITDLEGNVLLDTLIRPSKGKRISSDATAIHGINIQMLENAPTFKDIYSKFCEIIGSRTILIYNAEFDARLIAQTALQDEIKLNEFNALCIMIGYSTFVGEWSEYHGNYKFQKLIGGDHTAIGDCRATLEVIKRMANTNTIEIKKKWWGFG